MTARRSAAILLASSPLLICCITLLLYWRGLHGPFLLDDIPNLESLKRWMDGGIGWSGVIFGNRSGPLGRPLSMATFVLNVALTGNMNSFSFKPTNLLIHLLCGLLIWQLLRQLLRRDENTSKHAEWLALLIATVWLWLPLQVSTVLYVIQRMAQLAALFMLSALWVYSKGRQRIITGRRGGLALIWLGVPLLTLMAAFSKENGILALPLALVLELILYAPALGDKRPKSIILFFTVTVILPTTLALIWLAGHPNYILNGYTLRDFTLKERLLTEPRILWSYVQTMFFPIGRDMGIYHDNYLISTGLLRPWTTLSAILAWTAAAFAALKLRRHAPLFSAGIAFFLVGHAIESTIIPLELYFEHRNYLPSVGLLMALAGGVSALLRRAPPHTPLFRRTAFGLLCLFPLLYAAGTWTQVRGWSSDQLFYAMQESYNPDSPRLESDLAARAMMADNLKDALHHISIGEQHSPASEKITSTIWRFLAYCTTKNVPPPQLYAEFETNAHGPISNFAMLGWEQLAGRIERGCPGLDLTRLAQNGQAWLAQDTQTPHLQNQWRTRYNLARIQAMDGDLVTAEATNHQAWKDSGYNNGVGVLLFQLNASLGRVDVCKKILDHLEKAAGGDDYRLNEAVAKFRAAIDADAIRKPLSEHPLRSTPDHRQATNGQSDSQHLDH